jgi:hypothetical protein
LSSAMELIVEGLMRLKDRQSLEGLKIHRRRLAAGLRAIEGFDCGSSIVQLDRDIAAIEAGLMALAAQVAE